MTQFARPVADRAVPTGDWRRQLNSDPPEIITAVVPAWPYLDEVTPDAADHVFGPPSPLASETLELDLSAVTDPGVLTDHVLSVQWVKGIGPTGEVLDGTVELRNGADDSLVATLARSNITTSVLDTHTLSAGEAGAILDYGDLYLRLYALGDDGSPPRRLQFDWVELSVPDAAGSFQEDAADQVGVSGVASARLGARGAAADVIAFGDQASARLVLRADGADVVGLGDAASSRAVQRPTAADSLGVGDTTGAHRVLRGVAAETVGLTDEVASRADLRAVATEMLGLTDDSTVRAILRAFAEEGIGLSDFVAAVFPFKDLPMAGRLSLTPMLGGRLDLTPTLHGRLSLRPI